MHVYPQGLRTQLAILQKVRPFFLLLIFGPSFGFIPSRHDDEYFLVCTRETRVQ